MDNSLLIMKGIVKEFPGVKALQNVDFEINKGEVVAVIGENGAGKSTLIKIIAGAYTPTKGEIYFEGKKVEKQSPQAAISRGIAVIYQELNYLNYLSLAENIFLGHLPRKRNRIDWKTLKKKSMEIQKLVGLDHLDPFTPVEKLSTAEKQLLEIARSYARNLKLIIMDEPTSALNEEETQKLFGLIDQLKKSGKSVIYITHKLDEIYAVASRAVVMRDGQVVYKGLLSESPKEVIIHHMVGREISDMYPIEPREITDKVLEVSNLNSDKLKDVSFYVRKGEIVGLYGLIGCGSSEIVRSIFGALKTKSCEIKVNGQQQSIHSPVDAIKAGLSYVPSERKTEGLILMHSVRSNFSIATLGQYRKGLFLSEKKESEAANRWIKQLNIKTPSVETIVESLSGGNQQKVVFAKWCAKDPSVFIMDEPTKGVDVGAKIEIYKAMEAQCKKGCGVLVVGSELPELIGICDRIYVVYNGTINGEFTGDEITQKNIIKCAIGEN